MLDLPDLSGLRTPTYLVDERRLIDNLRVLRSVALAAGCKILLAQKAFAMHAVYPLLSQYLDGTAASGLYEAKLGHDRFGKETHVFSPVFTADTFSEILQVSDHIVFNSFRQWQVFGPAARQAGASCGLRINPECQTQKNALYDPCAPGSRLGVTRAQFQPELMNGLSGLHFHTLCEQDADALDETLQAVEARFGLFLPGLSWVNFGGGHHITRPGYDLERLIRLIRAFRSRHQVDIYLEPGEAIALNAGYLVTTVIDVVKNDLAIAILDTSATCHMPDVLEVPYTPQIIGAAAPGEKPYHYRLGGPTCLAGDVIGDYSFDQPLAPGDRLILCDMAIYTMVKNNTFNGMRLPDIALIRSDGRIETIRQFGYSDFEQRLS